MITPEQRINMISKDIGCFYPIKDANCHRGFFNEPMVTVVADKYIAGHESITNDGGGRATLREMLKTNWPTDAHFMMYTHPSDTRLIKLPTGMKHAGIEFNLVAIDCDYKNHGSRPRDYDFANFLSDSALLEPCPNIVYATRGGARLVYWIEPVTDEEEFEQHYQGLIAILAKQMDGSRYGYAVDTAARDWTRMFRCPQITRENEKTGAPEELFNNWCRVLIDFIDGANDRLNLMTLKPVKRPPPIQYDGTAVFHGGDRRLVNTMVKIRDGDNRNKNLFAGAIYAIQKYRLADQDTVLNILRATASNAGLADSEIEQVIEHARKGADRK